MPKLTTAYSRLCSYGMLIFLFKLGLQLSTNFILFTVH